MGDDILEEIRIALGESKEQFYNVRLSPPVAHRQRGLICGFCRAEFGSVEERMAHESLCQDGGIQYEHRYHHDN